MLSLSSMQVNTVHRQHFISDLVVVVFLSPETTRSAETYSLLLDFLEIQLFGIKKSSIIAVRVSSCKH